ncbi:MAG: septum site-determining protein MinD, partial [Acutalibacteraceae bacterium]
HPDLMKQLVPILSRYYDQLIIDCPAGIGKGFISAVAAADRALVISTPDPICIRDSDKVRQLLEERGIRQQRLVINRFSFESFRKMQHYQDIDTIIDETGIRLIAVLPDDIHLQTNPAKAVEIIRARQEQWLTAFSGSS